MQKNSTLNKLIWTVAAIIAIAIIITIIAIIVGKTSKKPVATQSNGQQVSVAKSKTQGIYNAITDSTVYNSDKGQVVKGFPAGLVDTSNAIVQNSTNIVGKGYDQYTVNLTTTQSGTVIFDEYVSTLSKSPYAIKMKQTATAKIHTASIFASDGANNITVIIAPDSKDPKTNDITITYSVPNPATAVVPPANTPIPTNTAPKSK